MKYLILSLISCCLIITGVGKAHADPSTVSGISVSPTIEQISLSPGQNTASFNATVTNSTANAVVLQVSAEDFSYLNQNGGLYFYDNGQIDTNNPHGLLDFLSIGYDQIALAPGQSQTVPVSIINANGLAIGGHYAALLFKVQGVPLAHGNQVIVNQVVSSLIFLSTFGQGTQTTNLTKPIINRFDVSMPSEINTLLTNSGNTQTTPRGYVQVVDARGTIVRQGQINTGSGLILPSSQRLFAVDLVKTKRHVWPGVYYLRIYYRHDGQAKYSVYQQKIVFINIQILILLVVVIIALVLAALRAFLPQLPSSLESQL